jgi:hypothetical protein
MVEGILLGKNDKKGKGLTTREQMRGGEERG